MSQWNITAVTFQVAVHRQSLNVLALLLLPTLSLVGLIGNALVCIAIYVDRRLHNVTNYFLFSLAVADLLVCLVVMPLSIVVEVRHGVWTWSFSMCLLYVYADVFLCSASIVHMSIISLDRYLGISQPLRTRNKSKTLILIKITIVWLITLLISCPIAVLALLDNRNILQDNSCMIFSRHYIIFGSTSTFLIPFCIMAGTYVRTTHLLNQQASILSQKANDKLNGNGLRRTMPHRKLAPESASNSKTGYVRTNSTNIGFTNGNMHKTSLGPKASVVSYTNGFRPGDESLLGSEVNGDKELLEKRSTINRWKSRTSTYITNFANRVSRRNSLQVQSQELANEHKATRVLAVVFTCFFICWTPFFLANFIVGFCGASCELPSWLGSLFLWLGYISSTVNPLIYTVFNKRFRQAFLRILRCQCYLPLRDPSAIYSRNYTTIIPDTYTWSNNERDRTISVCGPNESGSMRRRNSDDEKKISLPNMPLSASAPRDSRATTEETSDEDGEQKPLLPAKTVVVPMKRSFTTLLSGTSTVSVPKSHSCVLCDRADALVESAEHTDALGEAVNDSDDTATMTSSTTSCQRRLTLFQSFSRPMKETFL